MMEVFNAFIVSNVNVLLRDISVRARVLLSGATSALYAVQIKPLKVHTIVCNCLAILVLTVCGFLFFTRL